jgi:hypothetical protein
MYLLERMEISKTFRFGILTLVALLAIVSVASAALPSNVDVSASYPGSSSYWSVTLSNIVPPSNTELPARTYVGWCSDINNVYTPTGNTFTPYSSLTTVPAVIPYANWKAINYIINHDTGYDWKVVQAVIWHYDGWGLGPGQTDPYPYHWSIAGYSHTAYDALLADVEAHYTTYNPGTGDVYAVILWQKEKVQAIFVEAKWDDIIPPPPVPEFPTMALPIGMMVGMVGAVYFVKGREK